MPRTKTMDMEKSHFAELCYDVIGDFMNSRLPFQNRNVQLQFSGVLARLKIENEHGGYSVQASVKEILISWWPADGTKHDLTWYKWHDDDDHQRVVADFKAELAEFYAALDDSVALDAPPVSYDASTWPALPWPASTLRTKAS